MESANQLKDDTTAQSTAQGTAPIAFPPVLGVESPLALRYSFTIPEIGLLDRIIPQCGADASVAKLREKKLLRSLN